jgi:hypothetical protein
MRTGNKGYDRIHQEAVEAILARGGASGRVMRPWVQWLAWLGLSLLSSALFLGALRVQDLGSALADPKKVLFLGALFAGSGLGAWRAIRSSLPGLAPGSALKRGSEILLVLLVLSPLFLFGAGGEGFDPIDCCREGWACIQGSVAAGVFPWLVLGWFLSRNAAFRPFQVGAWSGISAFLLGAWTLQLHCPNWEGDHLMMAHLMPVAVLAFGTAFAGAYWFSRWRK